MPDMSLIAGAVSSLKLAHDMTKTLASIRDFTKLNETVIELQRVILAAQSDALAAQADQFSLLDRIRNLETEIARLKEWDAQKERYELTEVAARAFAYALKPDAAGSEPLHWICPTCYHAGKKSILQGRQMSYGGWTHDCPSCKLEIYSDEQE